MEMIVVPRSTELEEAEAGLRLALVAVVADTRLTVSTAMISMYLNTFFGFDRTAFSVQRHAAEDFIVRFARQQDLQVVLQTVVPDPPIRLIWNR
jgi:hypothetical protein